MKNPWLYEKDGDLNPGWLLVATFSALGLVTSFVGLIATLAEPKAGMVLVPSILGFAAFMVIACATMVISLGRAKVLNGSKVLSSLSDTMRPQPPYPGMDYDESD